MPINDLLARHQLAKLNTQTADNHEDRATFADLEHYYAARIDAWREALELPREGWPGTSAARAERRD